MDRAEGGVTRTSRKVPLPIISRSRPGGLTARRPHGQAASRPARLTASSAQQLDKRAPATPELPARTEELLLPASRIYPDQGCQTSGQPQVPVSTSVEISLLNDQNRVLIGDEEGAGRSDQQAVWPIEAGGKWPQYYDRALSGLSHRSRDHTGGDDNLSNRVEIGDEEVARAVERQSVGIVEARGGAGAVRAAGSSRGARERRDHACCDHHLSNRVVAVVADEEVAGAVGRQSARMVEARGGAGAVRAAGESWGARERRDRTGCDDHLSNR